MAEAFNASVCPHFLMELHVSLVCSIVNAPWLEYIPQLDDLTLKQMEVQGGYAFANGAPGLGIDWDYDQIVRLRVPGYTSEIV